MNVLIGMVSLGGFVFANPSFYEYSTFDEACKSVFKAPKSKTISIQLDDREKNIIESKLSMELLSTEIDIHLFSNESTLEGYAMVIDQLGKHYPMTVFVAINPDLTVKDVVLMIYREDYGQKVRKRRFLRQFLGKTIEDPIQVNNDITSLSGATISSYSIATGVKRVLLKLHTLKDKIQSMN